MTMGFEPYQEFAKLMGAPQAYAKPTAKQIEVSKSVAGRTYGEIIERDGFAFYRDQRIRTVDPDAFASVADLWPLDGEVGRIFLITCFGDLFCRRGGFCWFINVNEHFAVELIDDMDWFFGNFLQAKGYFESLFEGFNVAKPLLKRTPLLPNEMLAWTPALALGGSRSDSSLEIANIAEANAILAASGELQLHRY
jgi:hypothetical protein